jgi:hypothetical protein
VSQVVAEYPAQRETRPQEPAPAGEAARRGTRGRFATVVVMIVALVLAGVTRQAAQSLRGASQAAAGASSGATLSSMNSFALALLLGGLRGPLVMLLWTSSESQKTEKNLEDFDTKVEWIRLLQPEFDTVHIFQIWNKAYNISVQMASVANKYTTILDAIDYAKGVDAQRPNNINIVHAIGSVYADKLGGSNEKRYYIEQVRKQSKPHTVRQRLNRDDPGWRRLEMDPLLDEKGNLLPHLLKGNNVRPVSPLTAAEWNTGAELQYLEKYQPFPYGVSPLAIGYNYLKRAQVLQTVGKQRHAQLSDLVVDSRPALALKAWADEEWERGRRVELAAFHKPLPAERGELELPTAQIPLTPPPDPSVLDEAVFSYDRASQLMRDAEEEYKRHLRSYTNNASTYQLHLSEVALARDLMGADRDYLKAMRATGAERTKLATAAAEQYLRAMHQSEYVILKYYVDDETAEKAGYKRAEIDRTPVQQFESLIGKVYDQINRPGYFDAHEEDRGEFERYARRSVTRLQTLEPIVQQPSTAATQPK